MGEMLMKLLVLFLSIDFSLSKRPPTKGPGGDLEPTISQERLDSLNTAWRGIYWNDTVTSCKAEQIDAIKDAMFGAMELMGHSMSYPYESPGWNRFFLSDGSLPVGKGWGMQYHSQFKNIINAMSQTLGFPAEGNTKLRNVNGKDLQNWERMTPEYRIALSCNPISFQNKNECADPNVGAITYTGSAAPEGYNNIMTFCPLFFKKKALLPMGTYEPHKPENLLNTLSTREYILVHELFHCNRAIHFGFPIDDLVRDIPTFGNTAVYGSARCGGLAWKYTYGSDTKLFNVNADVRDNADNYAWFFTYNWFYTKFKWDSKGAYVFSQTKKREDTPTNSDPMEHQLIDRAPGHDNVNGTLSEEELKEEERKSAEDAPGYPQANCQAVGNDPMNLKCAFLGGQTYEEWEQEQKQEQDPNPTTSGVPPDPSPTGQMIFVYEWLDTPDKLQSWQITDIPVGKPLDWCGGVDLQYMVAAQNINGTEVPNPIPFPSDIDFSKIAYGGYPGYEQCTYRGNPDGPGTFDCPDFNAPVQCGKTPKVRELITCPATTNSGKSWAVSMVICQWGKSNVKQ